MWIGQYVEKFLNLDLKVEEHEYAANAELKNLMFAAQDIPDLMYGMNFSPNELMKYGQMEGQLLDLTPYVNNELTPEIYNHLEKRPDARALSTTPDGKLYTLPFIDGLDNEGAVPRMFIDARWLDATGLSVPKTLDEVIVMLRAFKNADVTGVGSDNIVPLAAAFMAYNPSFYFFNALGILGGGRGANPALLEGEAMLPVLDADRFYVFLETLKLLYDEGLIHNDFFTADAATVNAWLLEDRAGMFLEPVYVTGYTEWKEWVAVSPLTSDWNSKVQWEAPLGVQIGDFAMNSKTQYAEVGVRFANVFFAPFSRIFMYGPWDESPERLNHIGAHWDHEIKSVVYNVDELPDGVADPWTFYMTHSTWYFTLGTWNLLESIVYHGRMMGGDPPDHKVFNLDDADMQYRSLVTQSLMPHTVQRFPGFFFLEEEESIRRTDLAAVINPYLDEQIANFITGRRPLSEFNSFMDEMKSIGAEELEQIFKGVWANFKAALN